MILNHLVVERPNKITAKIKYLNIMTKTANAIDFFEKIRLHEKDRAAKFNSTAKPPNSTLIEKFAFI